MTRAHDVDHGAVPGRAPRVLCVGDVASDLILTLPAPSGPVGSAAGPPDLVLPLGAKVPYDTIDSVPAAGNAANAAVAMARLGLPVGLVTHLGADRAGRDALHALEAEGVDVALARLDRHATTNRDVVLRVGVERTILVHHGPRAYHWPHLRAAEVPEWLYLSSVGRDGDRYEDQLADWLEEVGTVRLVVAPGTYQVARGADHLARLFRRSDLVICNREEAADLCGLPHDTPADRLAPALADLGPARAVVTDAAAGAWGVGEGTSAWVPSFPDPGPVVDRTGAGDAFAATLVAGLVLGLPFPAALRWAPVNAAAVVQAVGSQAGLLTEQGLRSGLDAAPGFDVSVHPDRPVR